ncbi:NAD(P)H-binding protein [Parahaliea maris]|uniref:NAD(P)H-binding protein n=1 Tax=Parahaliea maris TaxID=2716870 RepID=A0A5C8ZTQ6_9GAMM|nr:NmrA family NAD(P)-binding protein [Parahaliea maris]TXS91855.1 NAD(P)H-binding protein [Parahaliea maris]
MRILIIGALGNLASPTIELLVAKHPDVTLRLTSHRDSGVMELGEKYPSAEVMQADWNDLDSLKRAVKDVDRVLVVMTDWVIDESIATPNLIEALNAEGSVELVLRFIALPPGLTRESVPPDVFATRGGAMLTLEAKPLLDSSQLPVCYVNAACWIGFNIEWFYGEDIRKLRKIRMPAATDMARQWVAEGDLAEAFVKILTDPAEDHVGREYLVTGGTRYTYQDQAELISRELGERVDWVDDDTGLRDIMGDKFDTLMTYLGHETQVYGAVPATQELEKLLGRERTSLEQYVRSIKDSLL